MRSLLLFILVVLFFVVSAWSAGSAAADDNEPWIAVIVAGALAAILLVAVAKTRSETSRVTAIQVCALLGAVLAVLAVGVATIIWLGRAALFLILGLMVMLVVLTIWLKPNQRQKRTDAGLCPECGYDLRASAERCPECGTPIPAMIICTRRLIAQAKARQEGVLETTSASPPEKDKNIALPLSGPDE